MYYFIINPSSRSGRGAKTWKQIENTLKKKNISYKYDFTRRHFHAARLAEAFARDHSPCTIIALGGDGTINEVLNGIHGYPDVSFGCIPTGSGNDFSRGRSWAKDSSAALETILNSTQTVPVDLGMIRYKNKQRYFGVSMGIGFDAAICFEAMQSRFKDFLNRCGLGKLTYIGIALKLLLLYKPTPVSIRMDGKKKLTFKKCYFVTVMNKKYEGGGLKLCPAAREDDGYLDVCVVGNLTKAKIFMVFPSAFIGKHGIFTGVHLFRCKSIEIFSKEMLPVHTDGESCGYHEHLTVDIAHHDISFLQGAP